MKETDKQRERALRVLGEAHGAWAGMEELRERRRRYVRYTYGDQWSDPVRDRDGAIVTEREQLTTGGRQPLSNNLIRRMVKAVVGRWRISSEDSGKSPGEWHQLNRLDELDARTLEEFLISGMAVHHVSREVRDGKEGVWVDNVSPDCFFVSHLTDSRCTGMELVGRLRDMSLRELLMRYSHGSRRRARELQELYSAMERSGGAGVFTSGEGVQFYHAGAGRCRVIEVWNLESREVWRCHDPLHATYTLLPGSAEEDLLRENRRRRRRGQRGIEMRWELRSVWHCRMLAPDGTVLEEFDSTLPGGRPPFAVKLYPLVDGNVHSLVEDVIDQQRHVNRLITLMDHMMGTAAKGVLLFPRECKLPGHTWKQLASLWADPGGIIPYQPSKLSEPHQVVTPMADIGASEMLQTQIKLFEDVSGVSETLMGKTVSGAIGVERYNSEVQNASVAIADILRTYADFIAGRNELMGADVDKYVDKGVEKRVEKCG